MLKKFILLAVCVFSLGTASATPSGYVVNGDFSNGLTGWTTDSISYLDYNGAYEEGAFSYDAMLQQTIIGAVGQLFLHFDFGANDGWYQYVVWNGVNLGTQTGDLLHYTFEVIGTGNDVLQFFGRNDWSYNFLDNVSLIPEPGSLALVGLGLILLATRRKPA